MSQSPNRHLLRSSLLTSPMLSSTTVPETETEADTEAKAKAKAKAKATATAVAMAV